MSRASYRWLPRVLLCLAAGWPGCAADQLQYEGQTGHSVPMQLIWDIPSVPASFEGSKTQPMLVDTGSPLTVLSQHAFVSRQQGTTAGTLEAFGLRFNDFPVSVAELFAADTPCDEPMPAGLLGADVLQSFGLLVDYQGGTLSPLGPSDPEPRVDEEVDDPIEVLFELLGGGEVSLAQERRSVGATRVVVELTVEGQQTHALVDTGSSLTLIDGRLFGRLPSTGRPVACCKALTAGEQGQLRLNLTRLKDLSLAGLQLNSVAAAVLPNGLITDALSSETGRDVQMIIGSTMLRWFRSHLDYHRRMWRLFRYREPAHVDPQEYLLAGFSFCAARDALGGAIVVDVFEGTDAATLGVQTGERLVAIDQQDVTELDLQQMLALLRQTPEGETASLTFASGAGEISHELRVENLLPEFR